MDPRDPAVPELLCRGRIDVTGRIVDASNATLFGTVSADGLSADCVYKPVRGERPLWDFPDGTLAGREVATYLVSEAAGLHVVPPTVLRDGPFGPGMVQIWVDTDDERELVDVCSPKKVPSGWLRTQDVPRSSTARCGSWPRGASPRTFRCPTSRWSISTTTR